jgi:hypothetical protein
MRPWSKEWFEDCQKWLGVVLNGTYRHWCVDWDGLPIDETSPEFECCYCFNCKCGTRMIPKYYPYGRELLEMHDDIFFCPKRRFWNFWKHTWVNTTLESNLGSR